MKLPLRIALLLSALMPLILAKSVLAACSFAPESPRQQVTTVTMPLQGGNINVGVDKPNNSVIFSQDFATLTSQVIIRCTEIGNFTKETSFTSTPKPLSPSGTGAFAGKLYETGVPGLGIVVQTISPSGIIPETTTSASCANTASCSSNLFQVNFSILKTGPVTAGVIKGSDLPCVLQKFGLPGNTLEVVRLCMSGVLTVSSQTCTTPDVNVALGTFDASRTFTGVGTTTAWKDAAINLSNCPRFYGVITSQGTGAFYREDGVITRQVQPTANSLTLNLTPNTSIINSASGIIGLQTGPTSATGVGIQIASGKVGDAAPTPVNLSTSLIQRMESTEATTAQFPLVARYIQTASTVSPGKANATVTFTINYN